MRVTLSGESSLCRSSRLPRSDSFLRDVNDVLELCRFDGIPPPPEVPACLRYRDPIQSVKELASEIGSQLQTIVDEQNVAPTEVMSAFVAEGFDFGTDLVAYRDDPDLAGSLWTFIATCRPNVRIPTLSRPANNILYSFFILSAKHNGSQGKGVVHQWVLALGTNTLLELADSIVCPLCRIADESSGPHRIPRMFKIDEVTAFDYDGGFEIPLSLIVSQTNIWCQFCSEGGCAHPILCGLAVAVNAESNDGFPSEIGGKGATPPYCAMCRVRPGPICVREGGTHVFLCPLCFHPEDYPQDAFIVDLTRNFFHRK
jgi:hypothetical protein